MQVESTPGVMTTGKCSACDHSNKPVGTTATLFQHLDIYQEEECDIGPRILDSLGGAEAIWHFIPTCTGYAIAFSEALVHHKAGDLNTAYQLYSHALLITEEFAGPEGEPDSTPWLEIIMQAYNNLGCIEYSKGVDSSARIKFEAALIFAKQLSDRDNRHRLQYATVLSNWCRTRWVHGDISETVYRALREVGRLRASVLSWDHPDMAAAQYNIAMADYGREQTEQASHGLKHYLDICSKRSKNGMRDVDPIPALVYLLQMKHEDQDDELSQELVRGLRTLQDKRHFQGPKCPECASVLNCVGTLLFHKKDFESSLVFFQEELRLEELLVLDICDISVAVTCNNIGRILQELGRYQEAVRYYERALEKEYGDVSEIYLTYQGSTVPSPLEEYPTAASLNLFSTAWYNLGLIQDKLHAHKKAITSFKMSLGLRKTLLGTEHPDVACLLYNIGVLQMEQNLLDDASSSFEGALRIRSVAAAEQLADCHVVRTITKLVSLHKAKGNVARALEASQWIVSIRENSQDLGSLQQLVEVSITLRSMSELYHAVGDLDHALSFAQRSFRLLERSLHICEKGHPRCSDANNGFGHMEQLISTLLLLASIHHERSDPVLANTVFLQAAELLSKHDCCSSRSLSTLREVTRMLLSSSCAPQA